MKQFRATQNTPQYGPQTLIVRFVGKLIFIKGLQESSKYVQKLIDDFEKRGASVMKGNGGWIRVDIIKDNKDVILGPIVLDIDEMSNDEIEGGLYEFFSTKYRAAKFLVQEIEE